MILFVLAWRSLWRNKKRTWISISAIASALALLMAIGGIFGGMGGSLLENGTELFLGHIQIHDSDFLPDRNLYDWIGDEEYDLDAFLQELGRSPGVVASAPRVLGFGLLSTGEHSYGAQVIGIDPRREPRVSSILNVIPSGRMLSERPAREILLGTTLAKSLGAEVETEIALVTQSADGTTGNDLYTVVGTFDSGSDVTNRSLAFVHWRDFQELLVLEDWQIHELALLSSDVRRASETAEMLNRSEVLPRGALAESWVQLLPQLIEYLKVVDGMGWFLVVLVGIFAGFGTLNTMMMAVFERTHEVGMLNALGMGPFAILRVFLIESLMICCLGLAVGFFMGIGLVYYFAEQGIDLSRWMGGVSLVGSRMDPVLKAAWIWDQFLSAAVGLAIAVFLATLIPAIRASRMNPVEAMGDPGDG